MTSSVKTWGEPLGAPGTTNPIALAPSPAIVTPDLVISRGGTLKDLADEFAFFHHGLLHHVGFDPLPQFYDEYGISAKYFPSKIYSNRRIIGGFPDPEGYCVYAVAREIWTKLAPYFDQMAPMIRSKGLYFQVFRQTIPTVDMKYMEQHPRWTEKDTPIIDVDMIGLDGNIALYYWRPPYSFGAPIRLNQGSANPQTVKVAAALFSGQDPHKELRRT